MVADPDADDNSLTRVRQSDRLGDLRQRRRVDHDDIAFLGQSIDQFLDPLRVEQMELVHLFLTCQQELQARMQWSFNTPESAAVGLFNR